jgi:hypothetical protein
MAKILKSGLCNDTQNQVVSLNESTLLMKGGRNMFLMNGYVEVLEKLNGPIKSTLQIDDFNKQTREWNQGNPITVPDVCMIFGHFLLEYVAAITPIINECPIKKVSTLGHWSVEHSLILIFFKGIYRLDNVEVNLKPWGFLASNEKQYKNRVTAETADKKLFCFEYEFTLITVRKRQAVRQGK